MVDRAVARHAVEAAQRQARSAASDDLDQAHAVVVGRAQATVVGLIRARPGPRTTATLHNREARLLRAWYTTVHDATLAAALREQDQVPGAAEVEAAASRVKAVTAGTSTGLDPLGPLKATAVVWRRARLDGERAGRAIVQGVRATAFDRAIAYVADQHGGDDLAEPREAILRHWYARCYLASVDARMGLAQPLQAVTRAEVREVVTCVELGEPRRLIGDDMIPLVTSHGTTTTRADKALALGEVGVVDGALAGPGQNRTLRSRVTHSWKTSSEASRKRWAEDSGVPEVRGTAWEEVPGGAQSALIAQWLDDHRDRFARQYRAAAGGETVQAFDASAHRIDGPAEAAAAAMFSHPEQPRPTQGLVTPDPVGRVIELLAADDRRRAAGRSMPLRDLAERRQSGFPTPATEATRSTPSARTSMNRRAPDPGRTGPDVGLDER